MAVKVFSHVLLLFLPCLLSAQYISRPYQLPDSDSARLALIDSVSENVRLHQLAAFDSMGQPLSAAKFQYLFERNDTCVNDQFTRPRFENNQIYGGVDGVILRKNLLFDTCASLYPDYLCFTETPRDEYGRLLPTRFAFMVKRNGALKRKFEDRDALMLQLKRSQAWFKIYQGIQTKGDEAWVNDSIFIYQEPYTLDSCSLLYRLQLQEDLHFKQGYGGYSTCSSSSMHPEISVGIEGDYDEFLKYSDLVSGCSVSCREGLWTVVEASLVLYSPYGREIVRFDVYLKDKNTLVLSSYEYLIYMKRMPRR